MRSDSDPATLAEQVTRASEPKECSETVSAGGAARQISRETFTLAVRRVDAADTPFVHEANKATRYRHVHELGRGGMGQVDVVFDCLLARPVARKTARDEANVAMLAAEARVGAQLEHPSIVPIYDVGRDEHGRPSYFMRVVNGRTLAEVLEAESRAGEEHLGRRNFYPSCARYAWRSTTPTVVAWFTAT